MWSCARVASSARRAVPFGHTLRSPVSRVLCPSNNLACSLIGSPLFDEDRMLKSKYTKRFYQGFYYGSEDVQPDTLDLSFSNAEAAYKSKTNLELLRAYVVFKLCSYDILVVNNMKLMRFAKKILGKRLFELLMEMTFYGHFVAGANQVAIQPKIERLRSFGVKAILDYSAEEDISHEDAAKIEIASTVLVNVDSTPNDDLIEEDEKGLTQYKVHHEFADRRGGVSSARTFFYMNEAQCEKNLEIFLQCIQAVSGTTKGTGFAAIKLTALGRPQLLLQLSEAIIRVRRYVTRITGKYGTVLHQNLNPEIIKGKLDGAVLKDPTIKSWFENMTYDSEGLIHVLPWHGLVKSQERLGDVMNLPDVKTGKIVKLLPGITDQQEEMFCNMLRRLHTIFKCAQSLNVRVMVDAEQSYFQPAISRITLEMMRIYNMEKAIVFNTYQCYLKDANDSIITDFEQAERQNFYFGAKLVRGAYMEQERARAKAYQYNDPINEEYDYTTLMYNVCLVESLKRIKQAKENGEPTKIAVMVATHNPHTVRYAIQQMKDYGIEPKDRVICFGQLYGMCDQISFPLGQSGYSVYKYVPYGPVSEVLPYLSRRAQENNGVISMMVNEKRLIKAELKRRFRQRQFFYEPVGHYEPI